MTGFEATSLYWQDQIVDPAVKNFINLTEISSITCVINTTNRMGV